MKEFFQHFDNPEKLILQKNHQFLEFFQQQELFVLKILQFQEKKTKKNTAKEQVCFNETIT